MTGRLTLGLYNSLDKKRFTEAHRRALARAGPVAEAFDCNLATFGFPYDRDLKTPLEVAEWVLSTTTIGQGGDHIRKLAMDGRFNHFPLPNRGFPPQLGELVVATRRPERKTARTPADVACILFGGRSVLLLFGLGPRGLPGEVMRMAPMHMDLSGRGISMETCTALGAAPAVVITLLRARKDG